jgi:hypothetical protein
VLVHHEEDHISLTDIARHRNPAHTDDLNEIAICRMQVLTVAPAVNQSKG